MRPPIFATQLLAILVAGALPALAQSNAVGNLSGTVTGPGGLPAASALVTVDTGRGIREARTDAKGQFFMPQLLPGTVQVKVTAPGMNPFAARQVVMVNQTAHLRVLLRPVENEVVEVIAHTAVDPTPDRNTATVGTVYSAEQLRSLPTIGDPISAAMKLAPGTPSGGYNFHGSTDSGNAYVVDGAEARSAGTGGSVISLNRDLIEQFQILSGGVSAKYGRFVGAMVNTVTKSGSNSWEGTMRHDLTSQSWNALPAGTNMTASKRVPRYVTDNQSYTLSGPIVPDQLFFVLGYQTVTPSSTTITNPKARIGYWPSWTQVYTGDRSSMDAKLDWQMATDHRLSLAWNDYKSEGRNGTSASGLSTPATSPGTSKSLKGYTSLGYTGVLSSNLLVDVKLSQTRTKSGGEGTGSGNPGVITWQDKSTAGSGDLYDNGMVPDFLNRERIRTSGVNLTWMPEHHIVEVGFQGYSSLAERMASSGVDNAGSYFSVTPSRALIWFYGWTANPTSMDRANRLMTVGNAGRTRLAIADPLPGRVDLGVQGLYINDTWTYDSHWSFNLGVRVDRFHYRSSPDGDDFVATVATPRLGATYDLKGDQKHLLKVGYSEYSGLTNTGDVSAASVTSVAPARLYTYYGSGTGADALNADGTVNWNVWGKSATELGQANPYFASPDPVKNRNVRVDSDLKPPRAREFNLSYKFADGTRTFQALAMEKRQDRYVDDVYLGAPGLGSGKAPRLLTNDPGGETRYRSLELQYRQQLRENLSVGANVTWSSTRSNQYSNGGSSARNNYGDLLPNDVLAPLGPQYGQWSSATTPFTAHLDVTYTLDLGRWGSFDTMLTGSYWGRSFAGYRSWSGYLPSSISDQGYPNYATRYDTGSPTWWPRMYSFDFHMGYELKLYRKLAFTAALDVKNVFNKVMPMYLTYGSLLQDANGKLYSSYDPSAPADWYSNAAYKIVPNPNVLYSGFRDGDTGAYTDHRSIQVRLGLRF